LPAASVNGIYQPPFILKNRRRLTVDSSSAVRQTTWMVLSGEDGGRPEVSTA
jgi:hypothetical protein